MTSTFPINISNTLISDESILYHIDRENRETLSSIQVAALRELLRHRHERTSVRLAMPRRSGKTTVTNILLNCFRNSYAVVVNNRIIESYPWNGNVRGRILTREAIENGFHGIRPDLIIYDDVYDEVNFPEAIQSLSMISSRTPDESNEIEYFNIPRRHDPRVSAELVNQESRTYRILRNNVEDRSARGWIQEFDSTTEDLIDLLSGTNWPKKKKENKEWDNDENI